MQKKDIIVGQDYALEEWEGQRPRRVRIVSFGEPRKVYGEGRFASSHTVRDGIKVQFIDPRTGQPALRTKVTRQEPTEEQKRIAAAIGAKPVVTEVEEVVPSTGVVISRHIKRPWETQEQSNQARAAREAEKEVRIQTARERKYRVNQILAAHGLGEVAFGVHSTGINYNQFVTAPSVIEALIGIAGLTEDNGQAKQ